MKLGSITEQPILEFLEWLNEAIAKSQMEIPEPTAMTLATASNDGLVDARVVLLKGLSDSGFTFFTNLGSAKAIQLSNNPSAALCFYWGILGRQVRVRGSVEQVDRNIAREYFATRRRMSQLGAWASHQSQPLPDPTIFEADIAFYNAMFDEVLLPPFWSGFLLKPKVIEFWQEGAHRLHHRLQYKKNDNEWVSQRLYP